MKPESLGKIQQRFILTIKWRTKLVNNLYSPQVLQEQKHGGSLGPKEGEAVKEVIYTSGRHDYKEKREHNNQIYRDAEIYANKLHGKLGHT